MVIHTFGDYVKFHPHPHAIFADWLFRSNGTFYCLPKSGLKELEEILCSKVLTVLKREEKIGAELIGKLMNRRHRGFSVYAGNRVARDDRQQQQSLVPMHTG